MLGNDLSTALPLKGGGDLLPKIKPEYSGRTNSLPFKGRVGEGSP